MSSPLRIDLVMYGALALLALGLGVRALTHGDSPERPATAGAVDAPAGRVAVREPAAALLVHVAGAVRRPGVYRLREGARVQDAVRRAGGATRRGDTSALNLAARVEDGRQVIVPRRTPGTPATVGAAAAAPGSPVGQNAPPLSLSTATEAELDTLDGVGPVMARKIIEHRTAHGGFSDVDELGDVPGIGDKRLDALRDRVTP